MFRCLFPCAYARDVFSIDYQKLFDKGYRGILFDVDNTLVHHGDDATPQVEALFARIHAIGLKTILVSNNNIPRLERFVQNIDTPYIPDADKPNPQGFEKALSALNIAKQEALCIGDQVFTDIYGANRCGLDSILVHFITVREHEKIGIRRHVERFILFFYRLCRSCHTLDDVITKE